MNISADRITGAFFLLFGLALYFMIIPLQVETGESSFLAPDTIPNALSVIIAFCGTLLMIRPADQTPQMMAYFLRTAVYVAVISSSLYAMSVFGFLYVAPVLALVLMLMIGERRPIWIIAGAFGMPMLIWFLVVHVLERGLP
jgi:putative tricarboxylic transport membrane protein